MGGIDSRWRCLRSNLTTVIRTPYEHTTRPQTRRDARQVVRGALGVAGEPGRTARQQSFLRLWCAVEVLCCSRSHPVRAPSRSSLTTSCQVRGRANGRCRVSRALSYNRPVPPRGLSRAEAAKLVADGRMPQPRRIDGRKIWDIRALDLLFDMLPIHGYASHPARSWADA
jgi:hypothetical protein